jgi:uncharacterized protein (DUF2164 family)
MEQKFNILTWFKGLAEGWKIGSVLVGAVIVIAHVAVKIDHWKDKGVKQENIIEHLKQSEQNQKLYNHVRDSIKTAKWIELYKRLDFVSDSLGQLFTNIQTLTDAVGTIGSKMTNTVPELYKLMGGLQFKIVEEVQTKSVYPGTIIKYMKIDTTLKR